MDPNPELELLLTRRRFLELSSTGIGAAALATLVNADLLAQASGGAPAASGGLPGLPHFAPKAKRVIYLFQGGAPSQHELWDYKPKLAELRGTRAAGVNPRGTTLDPNDSDARGLPCHPVHLQVRPAWRVTGVDQ